MKYTEPHNYYKKLMIMITWSVYVSVVVWEMVFEIITVEFDAILIHKKYWHI